MKLEIKCIVYGVTGSELSTYAYSLDGVTVGIVKAGTPEEATALIVRRLNTPVNGD